MKKGGRTPLCCSEGVGVGGAHSLGGVRRVQRVRPGYAPHKIAVLSPYFCGGGTNTRPAPR